MKKLLLLFTIFLGLNTMAHGQLNGDWQINEITSSPTGLQWTMDLDFIDDNTQIILGRRGEITILDNWDPRSEFALEFDVYFSAEGGALSALYKKINGVDYYFTYSNQEDTPNYAVVDRWILDIEANTATHDGFVWLGLFGGGFNHLGGELMEHDGWLYLTLGDNGSRWWSQRDSRDNGKILRFNPLTGEGHPDNPLYNSNFPNSAESLQYGKGLRNGWTAYMRDDGVIFYGDVGQSDREEINKIDSAGGNMAWPFKEGELIYEETASTNPDTGQPYVLTNEVDPLFTNTHDDSGFYADGVFYEADYNGVSIVCGPFVENFGLRGLFFLDIWRDHIFIANLNTNDEVVGFTDVGDYDFNGAVEIIERNNRIYVLTFTGKVFEITGETLSIEAIEFDKDLAKKTHYIIGTFPLKEEKTPKIRTPYIVKYELNNQIEWDKKIYSTYFSLPQH